MAEQVRVRPLVPGDIPACERILRSLPDWFGFEETNAQYISDLETLPSIVAVSGKQIIGFLSLKHHTTDAAEVHVLAVPQDLHRKGIGRKLIDRAEEELAGRARLLQVKTLGPSHPDEGYARTRSFYLALGFIPLEEIPTFWGTDNPCLIMVKPLISG
jgi:ribosomal protein S18 acetylase RimI-like enzyme